MEKWIISLIALLISSAFASWTGETKEPNKTQINGATFYEISEPSELAWFANKVADGDSTANAVLLQDLIFGNSEKEVSASLWNPIGTADSLRYQGTFDGKGHNIFGLKITQYYSGLFRTIGSNGIVKNVNVLNTNINVIGQSGCIEGSCVDPHIGGISAENYGTIDSCTFSGKLYLSENSYSYVGGIAGSNYNSGTVTNCKNLGLISVRSRDRIGGIVGYNTGTISHCQNRGKISVVGTFPITTKAYIGGITGINYNGIILDNINSGDVYVSLESDGDTGGLRNVSATAGGIVGGFTSGTLERCSNYGKIYVKTNRVGPINNEHLAYSYAGGIAGSSLRTITDVSNYGVIEAHSLDSMTFVGGIAGILSVSAETTLIKNAFVAIDSIISDSITGIFFGRVWGCSRNNKITNAYYDKDLLPNLPFIGSIDTSIILFDTLGLMTEEMQSDEFALNLNTTNGTEESRNVWERCKAYPVLIGNCSTKRDFYSEEEDSGTTKIPFTVPPSIFSIQINKRSIIINTSSATQNRNIAIFDIHGNLIDSKKFVNQSIAINVKNAGFYLVKIGTFSKVVRLK
ncbi:MAG: T9SS type A sorting domain-containing protein [Fibrobacteraceae bacterium]|nr:T9SS type A sorting domain-containing protein [Fibrobacteraceae bacterium]